MGALGPRPLGPWDLRYLGPKVRGPEVRGPKAQGLMTLEVVGGRGGVQNLAGEGVYLTQTFSPEACPAIASS